MATSANHPSDLEEFSDEMSENEFGSKPVLKSEGGNASINAVSSSAGKTAVLRPNNQIRDKTESDKDGKTGGQGKYSV